MGGKSLRKRPVGGHDLELGIALGAIVLIVMIACDRESAYWMSAPAPVGPVSIW